MAAEKIYLYKAAADYRYLSRRQKNLLYKVAAEFYVMATGK
jgi:hypothetical protein